MEKRLVALETIFSGELIKRTPKKHGYVLWQPQDNLNNNEDGVKHQTINESTFLLR